MLHVIITIIKDKYYPRLFPNQDLPAPQHHPVILKGKWSPIRRSGLIVHLYLQNLPALLCLSLYATRSNSSKKKDSKYL